MATHFQGNSEHPQHISVGAVVHNKEDKILAHYFPSSISSGYWKEVGCTDFYLLMRETLEPNESLEMALIRGIREELNATATIEDYLGSIVSTFESKGVRVQKTTLYFLCPYTGEAGEQRDRSDEEGQSELVWKPAEFLIEKMLEQRTRLNREDLDESAILKRYLAQHSH